MERLIDDLGGPLPFGAATDAAAPSDQYGALAARDHRPAAVGQGCAGDLGTARRPLRRHAPTPQQILADDPDELRVACGFSRAKVAYLRSLAEHVLSGELELDRLPDLDDDQVLRELTAVKGIGEWTAHMFLMFTLHRPDVLPTGDLGVRNAAMRAYGLERPPAPAELQALAEPWRPYRTRACLYLWRSLANEPV